MLHGVLLRELIHCTLHPLLTRKRGRQAGVHASRAQKGKHRVARRYQPIYLGSFDFEFAVKYSRPLGGSIFGGFKVPDPQWPAWRHAQVWALKIGVS